MEATGSLSHPENGHPVPSPTLKLEAAGSYKTLVTVYQTTRHHVLEDSTPQNIV